MIRSMVLALAILSTSAPAQRTTTATIDPFIGAGGKGHSHTRHDTILAGGTSQVWRAEVPKRASATGSVPADARANILTRQERAQGWRLLFNGRDLAGWQSFDGTAPGRGWSVVDGTLRLSKAGGGTGGGDLVTAQTFGAFELTLDWRVEPGGNSGILYLARYRKDATQPYETGPEMQILDDARHPDGRVPTHRAGALYDLTVPPAGAARPAGRWNHARILVERGRIRHWLNGVATADVRYGGPEWRARVARSKFAGMPHFGTFPNGVIALQDHGDPVAFRNIKLRRIGEAAR